MGTLFLPDIGPLKDIISLTDLENKLVVAGEEEGWGKGIGSLGWTCTHCCI